MLISIYKSFEFALTVKVEGQAKTISQLEKGVNNLTNNSNFEKERKLNQKATVGEIILYFMVSLKKTEQLTLVLSRRRTEVKKDDINGISIQRIH